MCFQARFCLARKTQQQSSANKDTNWTRSPHYLIDLRLAFCVNEITYVCYRCCFRKTLIILASLQFTSLRNAFESGSQKTNGEGFLSAVQGMFTILDSGMLALTAKHDSTRTKLVLWSPFSLWLGGLFLTSHGILLFTMIRACCCLWFAAYLFSMHSLMSAR